MLVTRLAGAWSQAEGSEDELAWLGEYLTFKDPSAFWRGAPPTYTLLRRDGRFPSGLADKIAVRAAEAGITIEVRDERGAAPEFRRDYCAWLRDYQLEAFDAAVDHGAGILQLPTGSGKTEIFAALAWANRGRWLFLAHREILVRQAAKRFAERTGRTAGLLVAGEQNLDRVTCATFQSFIAHGADWSDTVGLVIDEAHTVPAKTFFRAAMGVPARVRIGLSATPLAREDRRSVMAVAALGPVIYRLNPAVLIARGLLARPRIRMLRVTQQCDRPTWQGVYGEAIVRSTARNRMVVEAALRCERPFLVFVKQVDHGRALARALAKTGLNVEFVWGQHTNRARAVRDLERSALDCIVCSVVFQEGLDIPCLRGVIVASGGRSAIAAVQRIGRGSRVEAGKTEFEVWDFMDDGNELLKRHSKKRKGAYEGEGYEVEVVECLEG